MAVNIITHDSPHRPARLPRYKWGYWTAPFDLYDVNGNLYLRREWVAGRWLKVCKVCKEKMG